MDDLEKLRRSLGSITAGPVAGAMLKALADVWVTESKRKVPVDTGQLKARIAVTAVSSSRATVQADTPYAGFVEYGTRYQRPQPYFRPGELAARDAGEQMGAAIETELRRSLTSGGVFNPRNVKWTSLRGV